MAEALAALGRPIVYPSVMLENVMRTWELSTAAKSLGSDFADVLTELQELSTLLVDSQALLSFETLNKSPKKQVIWLEKLELFCADLNEVAGEISRLHTARDYRKRKEIARIHIKTKLSSVSKRMVELRSTLMLLVSDHKVIQLSSATL